MLAGQPEAKAGKWPPRVVIAAPQGKSGKTTVSLGLCAALVCRGVVVQPFKKGPDYIDPSWLAAAAGRDCHNLDIFLIPEDKLLSSFQCSCSGADLALIEGAMGLYDGLTEDGSGSTAQVARWLGSPIIMVVNTARMTRSVAAMLSGYQSFEPQTKIAGVILNNVAGSRHESKLVSAVERYCGIPVLGAIPRNKFLHINQRHLGLIPCKETETANLLIERIAKIIESHVNLDSVLNIARQSDERFISVGCKVEEKRHLVRIGILEDKVFNFYYPENLDALRKAGADLVFINSLKDQKLPDIDGLYIGGGFPELFLKELEANSLLRLNIAQAIENGMPVYAECAGLMYLCRAVRCRGKRHEMVGAIPGEVEVCQRPQGHGYVELEVMNANPLFPVGMKLRGHQFHYSRLITLAEFNFIHRVERGRDKDVKVDGILYKNVLASYTHLHASGVPQWAEYFVALVKRERKIGIISENCVN